MLTVQQLAGQLNVKTSWVRQQVFKKNIPYKKISKLVRFDQAEINQWIEKQSKKQINDLGYKSQIRKGI